MHKECSKYFPHLRRNTATAKFADIITSKVGKIVENGRSEEAANITYQHNASDILEEKYYTRIFQQSNSNE